MSFFKVIRIMMVFIGLVFATSFLSSCDGAVKHSSQEADGYGGHSAGGHGGHGGGAGH
ncbi:MULTISPECIES: hypothetical protein [Legionella]|uniref:Lipoprotein n=1 Tax=Legionella rubrilucens TaxID=458 RepID=A0A0W0XUD1_9GAMM|nr:MULTISPECIES: hypothetical protein [Legionella]KTD48423.1 hypothetical protein Lrub_0774 [Legionella rubrilucens]MDX1837619.1 hypothetical protein [Legionella taurinensis]